MTNMAASGSSNGQTNRKENGGNRPTLRPQQESPVKYIQWLKSFFSCLRTFLSRYNLVHHHQYRNPSVSPKSKHLATLGKKAFESPKVVAESRGISLKLVSFKRNSFYIDRETSS